MRKVLKLAVAFLREYPIRVLLTSLATAASCAMVVWVGSGYDALLASFDEYANKALGRYVLAVAPISSNEAVAVPDEALALLKSDSAVAEVEPMWAKRIGVRPNPPMEGGSQPGRSSDEPLGVRRDPGSRGPRGSFPGRGGVSERAFGAGFGPGGPGGGGLPSPAAPEAVLLATESAQPLFAVLRGRWLQPNAVGAIEAVVSKGAAARLGAEVGTALEVGGGEHRQLVQIVGVIDAPTTVVGLAAGYQLLQPGVGEIFVGRSHAEKLNGAPIQTRFLGVSLKPGTDTTRFRFGWAPRLGGLQVPLQFQEAHDIEERLDETASADNVRMQAYAATGIALLVALLVILSTLSMGADERGRQLAILRAVAFTRLQVGFLVVLEGVLLASIGLVGGLIIGQLLLSLASGMSRQVLRHGALMGGHSILLAAISAYGGAALAAILPTLRAIRVRPLDGMLSRPQVATSRVHAAGVLLGLFLLLICPLMAFVSPPNFEKQVVLFLLFGFATMAAGIVILAPGAVALVDRLFSPVLSRVFRLSPRMLASQITSNLWRTVGAALALTVGMGLYIGIQVWGYTMLNAFVPGSWAPDALIAFTRGGLPPGEVIKVAELPGVDSKRCLPVVVEQPRLQQDLTNSAQRASIVRQDNVVILGIDLQKALTGDPPLLHFDWVRGSRSEALARLKDERGCVVPDHFLRETGLDIGDAFSLVPPENPEHPVRYTIIGSVRLPGWHWQTKHTGLRPRSHRAAAIVFAPYDFVAQDFGLPNATHVWLSYAPSGADPAKLEAASRAIYGQSLGREIVVVPVAGEDSPAVRVMPVEAIRKQVLGTAKKWLWVVSQVPLIALVIACFGVLNVILASVRARRFSLGVLRAIGFTRWALVRAIMVEGLLVGMVACVLSLVFGILAGWCGCEMAQYISFFGGMHPALVIPWNPILRGLAAVLLLSAFAAVWPALSAGRASPLTLLQQGRSSL
jgi:putative ABC transport system permease protein